MRCAASISRNLPVWGNIEDRLWGFDCVGRVRISDRGCFGDKEGRGGLRGWEMGTRGLGCRETWELPCGRVRKLTEGQMSAEQE